MPYVTVLPIKGNQWKTTGGSLGFLNINWFKTLRTMERTMKVTATTPTWDAVPSSLKRWDSGPATSSRSPMIAQ